MGFLKELGLAEPEDVIIRRCSRKGYKWFVFGSSVKKPYYTNCDPFIIKMENKTTPS